MFSALRNARPYRTLAERVQVVVIPLRWQSTEPPKKIKKLMCANRGEIAIRVFRAATELRIRTVGIFSEEDIRSLHRYKADEAYLVGKGKSPVGAYLDVDGIIEVAKENGVDAIHPGYGFLSERVDFAQKCRENGITFVGPPTSALSAMADKTSARELANRCNVPVVPGTDGPVKTLAEAEAFVARFGLPIIIKAAMGGGGRGMRVVMNESELKEGFERATSEALTAFGDGTVFLERFVDKPRHIEVQLLGDKHGNILHLHERDCSVQRRHQKVIEIATSVGLPEATRAAILEDSVKLAKEAGYYNAGTAEFLVDQAGQHYFIEVNPRIQVEHTVTEVVTGVDLVQAQIRVAEGTNLTDMGLTQGSINPRGYAVQCRITTEDPAQGFKPDTGRIEVWRPGEGMGIRLDGGSVFAGAVISPHYDSMLVKVTASAMTLGGAIDKMVRALDEFRIRGVKTNVPFVQNVLKHPDLAAGRCHTRFIDENPELFKLNVSQNRGAKILNYLADLAVNGHSHPGATGGSPSVIDPIIPEPPKTAPPSGMREVYVKEGPEAFARAVRAHKGLLVTDTTMRDAHQSLLATRLRTLDLKHIAPMTSHVMAPCYSLENWGGATFDVALRFLHECPWDRLAQLRELIPNIPFQMLFRGSNGVGYTAYPDNVLFKFCELAQKNGMDVFRVFDSLNYVDNLLLGIEAAGKAGGIVEGTICYTGDVTNPRRGKYNLDYYMDLAKQLEGSGMHVLAIKDMAGLLRPNAASLLIGTLREQYPDLPIHVHTHDTSGAGVASMIRAAESGADAVDLAVDSMSGMTSQPSLGATVASLEGTPYDTGINLDDLTHINNYWEQVRELYRPFESGQLSGSFDVYHHEMPGGQYTNLMFQSKALGLADRWPQIKKAYAEANMLLGDIVKVTPSSKVVGDLAQFMVQNDLTPDDVHERARDLNFPMSVVDYFQGSLGVPHGGFPEPLRSNVLKDKYPKIEGRPSENLPPVDFAALQTELEGKTDKTITECDVMSAALYPKVFDDYLQFHNKFGPIEVLPTRPFLEPLKIGEEIRVTLEKGKLLVIRLLAVGDVNEKGERDVFFTMNGQPRHVYVQDKSMASAIVTREKADTAAVGSVGAPMPGVVVDLMVKPGETITKDTAVAVLSAMKMETVVSAPVGGKVKRVVINQGDELLAGDLVVEVEPVGN